MISDRLFVLGVLTSLTVTGALVAVGLEQRSRDALLQPVEGRPPTAIRSARQAPDPPAAARRQLARLSATLGSVDGSIDEVLDQVRGAPAVVNVWASWCPPCRAEFPILAEISRRFEGKVAFVGIDANDSRDRAAEFLKDYPVPYPSIFDEDGRDARAMGAPQALPVTVFFDAEGRRAHVRVGGYASPAALDADVRAYLFPRP